MRAFRALALNTVRASFRNRTALFFTLGLAVLFMVIFGELFSGNSIAIKIGIIDNDNSASSQRFVQILGGINGVTVEQGSVSTEADNLKHAKLAALVTIPAGFDAALNRKPGATTQALLDVQQASATSTSASIADQIIAQVAAGSSGGPPPPIAVAPPRIAAVNQITAIDFFLPAMIAYIILQSGINFVAIGLVELRVRKVLRRYRATPLTAWQILAAQITGGALTVLLQIAILIALGLTLFQAKSYGNWLVVTVPILLGTAAFVGIGFLLTSAARTSEAARGLASAIAFPMMFLSGIFFPVESLPSWLQALVRILPLTWLSDAMHQVMNDGRGLDAVTLDCLVLAGWAIVTFALASWRFRWD